jgi:hypothetical protein
LTCNTPVCLSHALHVEPAWDFCPRCARLPEVLARHGLVETLGCTQDSYRNYR